MDPPIRLSSLLDFIGIRSRGGSAADGDDCSWRMGDWAIGGWLGATMLDSGSSGMRLVTEHRATLIIMLCDTHLWHRSLLDRATSFEHHIVHTRPSSNAFPDKWRVRADE